MFSSVSMPGSEKSNTASTSERFGASLSSSLSKAIGTTLATCGASVAGFVEMEAALAAPAGPVGLAIDGVTLGLGTAGCIVTAVTTAVGAAMNSDATLSIAATIPGYTSVSGLTLGAAGAVVDGQQGFDLGLQIGNLIDDTRGMVNDISGMGSDNAKEAAASSFSLLVDKFNYEKDLSELAKELGNSGKIDGSPYTGPDPGEGSSFDGIGAPGQSGEHQEIEIARDDTGRDFSGGGFASGGYAGGGEHERGSEGLGDEGDRGDALA